MKAEVHCITLFQHLSSNMCVFMCMDHFNAGASKRCSKLGIFKQICYNERSLNWRFAWGSWIYLSIKYFIQKHNNSCAALSPPDWDVKNFVLLILNSTALESKSFWKIVHITKQPKPTQQIYMLQHWFHSELIRWRSHILIHDFKTKDYIQDTKVSTSDLLMNIWLLPCTLSEHSSLARSLIICGIKTSFSTCLSLEFSARVKKKIILKKKLLSIHQEKSI